MAIPENCRSLSEVYRSITAAPAPRVETFPSLEQATRLQRATIHLIEQQGDRFSSQSVPQWLVNVVGIEIVLNLVILTTLIRRTLRRWLP